MKQVVSVGQPLLAVRRSSSRPKADSNSWLSYKNRNRAGKQAESQVETIPW